MLTTHHYRNIRTWIAASMIEHGIKWLQDDLGICELRAAQIFADVGAGHSWTRPDLTAYRDEWDIPAALR